MTPIKGRGFINQGSGLGTPKHETLNPKVPNLNPKPLSP